MAHPVISKQNNEEYTKLLRASAVAYRNAKGGEIKITYFLIVLAIAYPVTYIFIKNNDVKLGLYICSFSITLIIQFFSGVFSSNSSKGALFKEEFDTLLFGLPWKTTLKKPDMHEVTRLANKYKGPEIRDWYSTRLSPSVPAQTAVAVLQHSNTSWDIGLRKIYRKWLRNILITYSLVLVTVLVVKQVDLLTTFLLFFSLLSFYIHLISLIRGHSAVIKKREAISNHLDEIIQGKKPIGITELRDVQDEIYLTRQESAKVPNFFFRWYQQKMNEKAEKYIDRINRLYEG